MVAYGTGNSRTESVMLVAGGAITTADVGKAVVFSSGKVIINTTAGADAVGVVGNVQRTLSDGDPVEVIMHGICTVQGGANITRGASLMSANDGQLVTATGTSKVLATALEAGTDGGFFKAFYNRAGNLALA